MNRPSIQEVLGQTFQCERFHCRLLLKSCVERQRSWDPQIYQGCMGCKQGLEVARKAGVKVKSERSKRSSSWRKVVRQRKEHKRLRFIQENG